MKNFVKYNIAFLILISAQLFWHSPNLIAQEKLTLKDLDGKWEILNDQSEFTFKSKTFGLFTVKGTMGGLEGNINFDNFNTDKFVKLSLKPSTLNTGNDTRDEDLRSENFLYVDKYPQLSFSGGKVDMQNQEEQKFLVTGKLTIRGVTNEESIPVKLEGYYNGDKNKIEFTGSLKIDRNKYNVDYTGRLIADMVKISYTIIAEKK